MLVLSEKQVKELEEFIQELPTKFGIPLLNQFRKFSQENAEAQKANISTPEAVAANNGVEIEAE